MASVDTDRNLLFGLLALQNGLVDQGALFAAFAAWTRDKSRPLADHLVDLGHLDAPRRAVVEAIAGLHLQALGGDPGKSLAVLDVGRSTRESLVRVGGPEVEATLGRAASVEESTCNGEDAGRTSTYSVGSATSDGQRFQLLRPHARGGLGAVFVALDGELHREVALKQILERYADDPVSRQRFVAEAEITGGLEHPGVVPVYGLGADAGGRPYYAMRFIKGDSLKEAIARFHEDETLKAVAGHRSLELRKLLRRFLDVCNAIEYAHSRGVIHRDLKPANIIVGKHGETLVVDWGLAKAVGRADPSVGEQTIAPSSGGSSETLPGSAVGTPAYMSPEQARGELDRLGPRSDVYSLGATLYCLLTGKPPFEGDDIGEVLRAVQEGRFPRPSQRDPALDKALEAVCLKAMATKPEDRYPAPKALADDLDRWMADEPVSAWREPPGRRLRRWGRRNRLVVTALAATLVVAVAALAAGNVLVARQRDRAERNLAVARTVVDEMYTQVAGKLEDQEQMDDYQREILEKALEFYERFALPQSGDLRVRLEAGLIGIRVAEIRHRLGQGEAAQSAYRQAIADLSRLVADDPAPPSHRHALAQAEFGLASFDRQDDKWDECLAQAAQAAAIWNVLARERPDSIEYRQRQAECQGLVALAYGFLRRFDESDRENQVALALAEELVKEHPDSIDCRHLLGQLILDSATPLHFRGDLRGEEVKLSSALAVFEALARQQPKTKKYRVAMGECCLYLGALYIGNNSKFARWRDAHERGLAIFEGLLAEHPQCAHCKFNLSRMFNEMNNRSLLIGDLQAATAWAGRAVEILRALARPEFGRLNAQRILRPTLATRAETLVRLGRYAEALADYEEVLGLNEGFNKVDPENSPQLFLLFHALTKARLGDKSALARLGEQVRSILRERTGYRAGYWMTYYDAACVHAALARLALEDEGKPSAERHELAQPDLDHALELLDKARETGEFKGMIRLDEIRREPTLDLLRANPRFQLLLMDLVFPDKPFE